MRRGAGTNLSCIKSAKEMIICTTEHVLTIDSGKRDIIKLEIIERGSVAILAILAKYNKICSKVGCLS